MLADNVRIKRLAIKKIRYFSPVLEVEYNLVRDNCDYPFPKYLNWNYSTGAGYFDREACCERSISGNNILLGNSATLTNNHIEIIDYLSCINLGIKKVLCPLSYGNYHYADIIEKYGKNKLGESFVPVRKFLHYDDYVSLLSSCSHVIMNHVRQQGVGNVIIMLMKGATVFLREESPLYLYYKSLGIRIFTVNDLFRNHEYLNTIVSSDDIYHNKEILKRHYGLVAAINKTKELIRIVNENKKHLGI